MTGKLTPLQERFVQEYLLDLNATQAIKRAGSKAKNLTVAGAEFLANPNVRASVDAALAKRSERTQIDADWLLKRLAAEAEADVKDLYSEHGHLLPVQEWPEIWRKGLVAGIDVEEVKGPDGSKFGEIVKVRLSDRLKRLELIGKHVRVNAFEERVKHEGSVTLIVDTGVSRAPDE